SFSIEPLLSGIEYPQGPIEQMLFAQRVAKHEGMYPFNRLARLTFTDPAVNKAFPGGVPLDETVLIGEEDGNASVLHLCVRSGHNALKIATGYCPNREIKIHDQYRHAIIHRKLSDTEINAVFSHLWDNMEQIRPKHRTV